jgi:hypothetical protein
MYEWLTLKNKETGVEADFLSRSACGPQFDAVIDLFHDLSHHVAIKNMKLVFEHMNLVFVPPSFGTVGYSEVPTIQVTFKHPTLPIETHAAFPYDPHNPWYEKDFVERLVKEVMSTFDEQKKSFMESEIDKKKINIIRSRYPLPRSQGPIFKEDSYV